MLLRLLVMTSLLCTFPWAAWGDLTLPVRGAVTSGIGWRPDPFGTGKLLYHRGIDIAVPAGTPVQATRSGRVTFAGQHGGYGSTVMIRHDNGDSTLYGHNSSVAVAAGARVEAGDVIAYSGSSGRSTGPHVHYEVMTGGEPRVVSAKVEEPVAHRTIATPDQRQQLESRMDEAMTSIFSTIRESLPQRSEGKVDDIVTFE